jgi:hypothetical protein
MQFARTISSRPPTDAAIDTPQQSPNDTLAVLRVYFKHKDFELQRLSLWRICPVLVRAAATGAAAAAYALAPTASSAWSLRDEQI